MMNNNITSNCPDYDLLQNVYPSVIVDPDSDVIGKIRIITISTLLPEYKISANSTGMTLENDSFDYSFGNQRYVDDSCNDAMITPNMSLLGDTIWYMTHNCDEKYSHADTITQYRKPASTVNHSDYSYYQYRSWLDYTIQNCTKHYGVCKQ